MLSPAALPSGHAVAVVVGALALAAVATVSDRTSASFSATSTSPSNGVSTLTVAPPADQSTPASGADGAVTLSWSASPTADSASVTYRVLRRPSASGGYAQVAGPLSTLSYIDDPNADGTYDYVIRADVAGFTADSVARTGRSDSVGPTAATGLVSQPGAVGDTATVELSWTPATDPSGVAAYLVYRASGTALLDCATASYGQLPDPVSGSATNASITGEPLTYYCFYLTARDSLGHIGPASARTGPTVAQ